jgi:hypothetical protein
LKIAGWLARLTALPAEKLAKLIVKPVEFAVKPVAKPVVPVVMLAVKLVVSVEMPAGNWLEVPGPHFANEGLVQL